MHATLRRGDRFIETYYTDRWYNIFEIHAREDDRLKGWYCNIAKPAVMEAGNEFHTWTWRSICGWRRMARRRSWMKTNSPPLTWIQKHVPGTRGTGRTASPFCKQ